MAYLPVGSKRNFLFQLVERIRIEVYKLWYGPKAMFRLLETTVHPTLVLEKFGATIQHPVYLRPSFQIINATNAKRLTLSSGVHIGEKARIDLTSSVTIGLNSVLGQGSIVATHQNTGRVQTKFEIENQESDLSISSNVFIGANSIILCGVETIAEGTIIGAGSLVSKSIIEPGVYAGSPVKKIR